MSEWHAPAAAGRPGQLERAPDSATEHGVCSHAQSSRAKRGEEEKLLASFAGQITAFLKAREWVEKRKCAKRAGPQMLRGMSSERPLRSMIYDLEFSGSGANTAAVGAPPNRNKQTGSGVLPDFSQARLNGMSAADSNRPRVNANLFLEVILYSASPSQPGEFFCSRLSLHGIPQVRSPCCVICCDIVENKPTPAAN